MRHSNDEGIAGVKLPCPGVIRLLQREDGPALWNPSWSPKKDEVCVPDYRDVIIYCVTKSQVIIIHCIIIVAS